MKMKRNQKSHNFALLATAFQDHLLKGLDIKLNNQVKQSQLKPQHIHSNKRGKNIF